MSYGKVAVMAVETIVKDKEHPSDAWTAAAMEVFKTKRASVEKGCPRGAFLGLCEESYVRGVNPGSYTRSSLNKKYAVRAVSLLKGNKGSLDPGKLWKEVLASLDADPKKAHNSQMNVVIALWEEKLIVAN